MMKSRAQISKTLKILLFGPKKRYPVLDFLQRSNRPAAEAIVPLIDIAQVQEKQNLVSHLPAQTSEIWTYKNGSPARSLPPYEFYRLMAWRAFSNDATGIGFWNYANEGKDEKLNLIANRLTSPASSYSAIYDGPGREIISSRRWEAFSLGIEDYSILKLMRRSLEDLQLSRW